MDRLVSSPLRDPFRVDGQFGLVPASDISFDGFQVAAFFDRPVALVPVRILTDGLGLFAACDRLSPVACSRKRLAFYSRLVRDLRCRCFSDGGVDVYDLSPRSRTAGRYGKDRREGSGIQFSTDLNNQFPDLRPDSLGSYDRLRLDLGSLRLGTLLGLGPD